MSAVKFPLLTGFCGGLIIFAGCAYIGHRTAEIVTYRWKKPMSFTSLKNPDSKQLRNELLTLQAVKFSQVREDTPSDLLKAANYLVAVRNDRGAELRPLIDLQIATDYIEMSRLEQNAGEATLAGRHQQIAADILRSLGWQDVSPETTAKLARLQLWWKRTK
jgi:hypothetical protein